MKIALIGYGKMGKEIEAIALQRHHEIVLKLIPKTALPSKPKICVKLMWLLNSVHHTPL